jgi:DNA polymerase III epsilon subunit-like protein
MNNQNWVLIDTETTGFATPIYVVEIGAQKMCGWKPDGPPFRRLLNQNVDIPSESARVNGYTREILERDGEPAAVVYRDFAAYAGGLPLVAFNLEYDLDEVLLPEWNRLGITPMVSAGFCALRLAQRLLDPVPAGNCKLQTLRQYYRLPERGAHTAMGDVETVADLLANVLRPIAQQRQLDTWAEICAYAAAEWFPSRIPFGKFKGRQVLDARTDSALLEWLRWLSSSTNAHSASMGRWYLQQVESAQDEANTPIASVVGGATQVADAFPRTQSGMVIFVDPEIDQLRQLIAAARAQLAELEAGYMKDRHAVDLTQAAIFKRVREHYQKRDQLKLVIDYRSLYLKTLLRSGEEDAAQVTEDYSQAKAESDAHYEQAQEAAANRKALSDDEEKELKTLWKKLVSLYHPDRFAHQPDKLETYHRLTSAINQARENGDIASLREIANDPHGFILRQGWVNLDFKDEFELKNLRRLLDTLQLEIVSTLDSLNVLHESAEFELAQLFAKTPELLEEVAAGQIAAITAEIDRLQAQAEQLEAEIAALTGDPEVAIA